MKNCFLYCVYKKITNAASTYTKKIYDKQYPTATNIVTTAFDPKESRNEKMMGFKCSSGKNGTDGIYEIKYAP